MYLLARAGLVLICIVSIVSWRAQAAPIHSFDRRLSVSESTMNVSPTLSSSRQLQCDNHPLNGVHVHENPTKHDSGMETRSEVEMVVLVRRKSIFTKIRDAFRRLGGGIKHLAQKIGHGIKSVAKKIGNGIKSVAKKIGHGIKKAAQKVGHFIKTTGAKIIKVGLKIASTIGKTISKVVSFVPGVGKLFGKITEGVSEGMNKISDAIHTHIGGKLGRAMKNMDKAQKIEGYIPRSFGREY